MPAGIRMTPALVRDPRAVLGSIGFWAGDCAVLWAAFHAVGVEPPLGVVVLGYMLGQLGNVLPLPGGVGGVEPVMLGVLTASGVAAAAGAAAIVCYRAIALGVQATLGAIAFAALTGEVGTPRGRPLIPRADVGARGVRARRGAAPRSRPSRAARLPARSAAAAAGRVEPQARRSIM